MVREIDVLTSKQSFQTMEGESSRAIAQDYINYRLNVNGHVWHNGRDGNITPSPVENAMRSLGDEFEQRFRDRFDDMINQLHVTEQNAYDTFHAIVAETFADGVNWGRIVALFGFAGRFAIQCYTNNMQNLVDNIVDWVSSYMDNHLSNWISQHNGWVRFYHKIIFLKYSLDHYIEYTE